MSRWRRSIVAVFVIAMVTHVGGVWAAPRVIMLVVTHEGAKLSGVNQFSHPPLPTAEDRTIVRPSPDFAYSVCVLDLSAGPVRLQVPLTPPYTSVALFSSATDNYFVRNDRDAEGRPLDVIVVAAGRARPAHPPSGVEIVEAPSDAGLVLVRRVVERADAFSAIDVVRRQATCADYRE